MATQNLWDAAKAVLRGKFITIPQETRKYQIDNLILHLKQLEKEEQNPQNQQKQRNHKDLSGKNEK